MAVIYFSVASSVRAQECNKSQLQKRVLELVQNKISQTLQKTLVDYGIAFYPETVKSEIAISKGRKDAQCIQVKVNLISGFEQMRIQNERTSQDETYCPNSISQFSLHPAKNCAYRLRPNKYYSRRKIPYLILEEERTRKAVTYVPLAWTEEVLLK